MRSRSRKWGWRVCAVVLVGGLLFASVVGADDDNQNNKNPFAQILAKLDQILAAITGGGQDGNHTLRWDRALPAAQRFVVLAEFGNAAVLDKNTGLVWERSPATTSIVWNNAGPNARINCADKAVGGQKGWRLPSLPELASLVDPSVGPPGPTLPPGHPFLNVQSNFYWSTSTNAEFPNHAWGVAFDSGIVGGPLKTLTTPNAWCVRGGMNADQY